MKGADMLSSILTVEQIKKIHSASLSILEKIGVHIPHGQMLQLFADSGAKVDFNTKIVKIPGSLVEKSLKIASKKFILYGRDLTKTAEFGYGKRNYNSTAGQSSWVENTGDKRRYTTLEDVKTATRFAEALDWINMPGAMSDPHELDVSWRSVEVLAEMIRNTTKPVTFWFHNRAATKFIIDMLIALRGSAEKAEKFPLCYPFFEPISPLKFPFNGIDLIFETARINLPVPIGPMAQMGMSAPMSITATLAQQNAEILAGICMTQLIKPGLPICYGGTCHAFDMASTQLIFGGPEQAILGVAMTQMGKHYGLPVYINVGLTDSKRADAQAGIEAGITLSFGAAAGADIFGHMGICGVDQGSSLDILLMQNEIISYTESTLRKLDFSDKALALDEIAARGPGGNFIDTDFTAENFRKELWFPKLFDRNYYQAWMDNKALSMEDRCRQKKEEILKNHKPEPVSFALDKTLTAIVNEAKKELGLASKK